MTTEFLDYWFQYKRYICFPQTPNTTRRIGDFILFSKVPDENHKSSYSFYYRYEGTEPQLKTAFDTALNTKLQQNKTLGVNHWAYNQIAEVDGKSFLLYTTTNIARNKEPRFCYYKDFIRHIEYALSSGQQYSFNYKGRFTSPGLTKFSKLLEKDGKIFRNIRAKEFKEKFGKTIEEYIQEREDEKEFQKSVLYTTLVGEAYCTLERLRDECNSIMKGLQDGRHGYDLDRYKAFRNEIMAYNKYLGYRNDFIKEQVKKGTIRNQTLIMFLRDNAKKPVKSVKK